MNLRGCPSRLATPNPVESSARFCIIIGRLALLLVLFAFVAAPAQTSKQPAAGRSAPLLLEHVTVIVGDGSPAIRDATLVIRDDRIVQVAESNKVGSHWTVSALTRRASSQSRGCGTCTCICSTITWKTIQTITRILSAARRERHRRRSRHVSEDPDDIVVARRWNGETQSGRLIGPRVMVSSTYVDGSLRFGPHPLLVHNAVEARQAVRTLKAANAGFIKVYGTCLARPTSP